MKDNPLTFWDSSALVLLCVYQKDFSFRFQQFSRRFPTKVVWWASLVEITGAIARVFRNGDISVQDVDIAVKRMKKLQSSWNEINPLAEVRSKAVELVWQKSLKLRSADALQLAAALEMCHDRPRGRIFVVHDPVLADAAESKGFTVCR